MVLSRTHVFIGFLFAATLLLAPLTAGAQSAQVQALLLQIEEARAALLRLSAQQSAPSSSCVSLSRTLQAGARGEDVKALQEFLIREGTLASGNATGYFGPLTEAAVQAWQARKGIVSSGSAMATGYGAVGPRTRAALASACASASLAPPSVALAPELPSLPLVVPTLRISLPRSEASVGRGEGLRIAWQSTNAPAGSTVLLSLIDDRGTRIGTVAQYGPASGEYLWRVPSDTPSGCTPTTSAIDCIALLTSCDASKEICTLAAGAYRIIASLSNRAFATSPSFRVTGGSATVSNLLNALPGLSTSSVYVAPGPTTPTAGSCMHENDTYAPGTTLSVACSGSNCPSPGSGTGFITGTCTSGKWCIPFTAYCAAAFKDINVSVYGGGGAAPIGSGYTVACPQEGYRAYLSCPYGGCQSGWNTCKAGTWVRDKEQDIFTVGTQGPCSSTFLWCAIESTNGYGCVPSFQCVNGKAAI